MRETAIDSKGEKIATPARDANARATRAEMLTASARLREKHDTDKIIYALSRTAFR